MLSRILNRLMETAGTTSIAHEEFLKLLQDKECTVVDVREADEYARGHIPGAVNQPLSRFDPDRVPCGSRIVHLICQAGGRSAAALKRMSAAGRQDVQHYVAGMVGWRALRGPVET